MKRWEYVAFQRLDPSPADEMAELDQYGASGWELVAVTSDGQTSRYFLKRRVKS